jgi:hypothetical protein
MIAFASWLDQYSGNDRDVSRPVLAIQRNEVELLEEVAAWQTQSQSGSR